MEYRITYTDKQIIQLIESKKPDELDIEFEGIAEPKMKLVEYDELRNYRIPYKTKGTPLLSTITSAKEGISNAPLTLS